MSKRTLSLAAIGLVAALGAAPAQAEKKKAKVNVVNKSNWDIHHLYMSPNDKEDWGPDQLGEHVIPAKGGSFELSNIPCDVWDVKVVDEDGDECVIEEADVCKDNYEWKISNDVLLKCEGFKD